MKLLRQITASGSFERMKFLLQEILWNIGKHWPGDMASHPVRPVSPVQRLWKT